MLVVSANEAECAEIEEILSDDGLILLRHSDMRAVLARGHELMPDIAIVDRELLDGDGDRTLSDAADRLGRPNFPIIVLADSSIPSDAVYQGEALSTDYLAKPFSPPMLRARVRAWLARTLMVLDPAERGLAALRSQRRDRRRPPRPLREPLASVPLFQAAHRRAARSAADRRRRAELRARP